MDRRLENLIGPKAIARARDLEAAGITRAQLSRLTAAGRLVRVARGLYSLPGKAVADHAALTMIASRNDRVFFCLLTALRFHGLTTQSPSEVWIGIGHKERAPRLEWPPLRVVRYTGPGLSLGIETHVVDGIPMRFTSIARTVVDCFKFRNKIGIDVALEALREARRDRRVGNDEIWALAQQFRLANVMRPYMESFP